MKISTNCSSLVILGDDFFPSPPFFFPSFLFLFFFSLFFFFADRINEVPQQGTRGPIYNNQINNKHIIYHRGLHFTRRCILGAFVKPPFSVFLDSCVWTLLAGVTVLPAA